METKTGRIIYEGNSLISLESLPDYPHPVVIKRPSKPHASRRHILSSEKEYEMTRSLSAVAGVRKAFEQQSIENQPALILEYIDGQILRDYIAVKAPDLRSRLEIAVDLAHILGKIHQQNVIHLDLNSKNILIGNKQQSVHIIDLGAASHIDRTGQLKVRQDQMLETLPYISPEQTGRINRTVDERSDLYSLGVVLYELMTRQLPFDSEDPLKLIHDHIARVPVSPSEVSSEIPEVLSAIILKLLSKNAEERYQSAAGVQADLEGCLQRLSPEDTIEEFPLGEIDYASRLRFPQKLYGRGSELRELESAFESVCREITSALFVGGFSGIGKTALVEELQQPVSQKGGYFLRGKFDQMSTTPYSGISQALALFVSQILTQPETQLAAWRSKILEVVGPNGRVLTDVVPSLELVIGPQPAVPDLSGQEAQNRFNYVFQRFFSVIARSEHPMCFFLDDLQWIDPGSLDLLKNLFSSPDLAHLLVVGAYRDNEVHEDHPLMALIADLEKADANLKRMTLQKLSEADVDALISDALRRDPGEIRELSRLVYSQTDGNPFFTSQVLRSLEDQGLIALDTATGRRRWDMDALRNLDVTASVVELLVGRLKELPVDVQETLKVAACIGSQFDIATLTVVTERDDDAILDHLQEAVAAGLIWERDDRGFFVHDRVQEAAYALVPPEDRDRTHLTIGRLLLADTDDTGLQERIFDIATHYNLGANLLTDPAERLELVRLNLIAGRKARLAAAFAASAEYLKQGFALLGEGAWRDHYRLTLDVHSTLIEVCNLNIQYEEVEALFDSITENAKQDVDAGVAHKALIMSCIARHELGRAISLAERYLERLDVTLANERESDLTVVELHELPQMENREKLAAMEILMAVVTPVIFSAPERLPSVVYTMLNLISRYGNNSKSGFAYASYAYTLCLIQRYQEGNRFGQLAVDLLAKYPDPGRAPGIMNMLYTNVRHWRQPVHDQITPLKTCHRMAMQAGDFEYGLYSLLNHTLLLWGSGKPLERCLIEIESGISLCQSKNQQFSLQLALMLAQSVLNLTGMSPSTMQLEGKWFSEETMMSRLEGNQFLLALYGLLKMKLHYLFGEPGAAYDHIDEVLKHRDSVNPAYLYTKISFYGALSCIAGLTDGESDTDRQERLENLRLFEEELKLWAEVGPMNYQHQYDLVLAERCRASEKHWEATQLYEKAIRGAHENLFVHDQALANELFAQFWRERGNDMIAETYMREARALYHQWEADAKVSQLEERYPQWFKTKTILTRKPDTPAGAGKVHTSVTQPITSIQLDMDSIISASQMLSAETDLEQLLARMITLVMANSGAETAVLLLKQENDWFVQARGDSASEKYDVLLNQPFDPADSETDLIPEPVFNYCLRSREVLVVGDARLDHRFAEDRMIQKHSIQSMACIPVLSRGQLKAMLYLENRQVADVFTLERLEILKHLSAQFGVSVENALLYDSLNKMIRELQLSDERYELAVSGSTAGIWDWDITSDTMHHSDRFMELLGYEIEDYSDSLDEFWNRLHPDDYRAARQAVDQHLGEQSPFRIDCRLQLKSGEYRWFHARGQAIWDEAGKAMRMSGSLTDITERKQVEEELRRSEGQFRSLMERSPLDIVIMTPDGKINQVNAAWKKFWGLSEEETAQVLANYNMLTDKQIENLGLVPLVERAFRGEHVILPPMEYEGNRAMEEIELEDIEARSRWIQTHLYSVKDANGEIDYVVGINLDLTELRQAEQEALEQREALARVDRTTSMGQLTGSISHELNQPLTGILSNAQAAELIIQSGQWEDEEMAEIMAEIVADAKRAGDVIRNLRQLYREQRVEFLLIDLNDIVEETIQLLHSEFIIQRVALTTEYASSMPWVNGNRVQVQQVLVNLVMNGNQAMSDKVRDDRRIHIVTAYDASEVKAWVEDNGSGIDPDRIDRIFEPLATWKPGHTGMGLAISNSIIQAHGGLMWAENRPEGGARVGFALPLPNKEDEA
jgi:PAS domain S-box-containing protein